MSETQVQNLNRSHDFFKAVTSVSGLLFPERAPPPSCAILFISKIDMSEYEVCAKGPLKIKGDSGIKKKKKKKQEKKLLDQVSKIVESVESDAKKPQNEFELTKAEIAFIKQQEKMQEERIKKKASMTHKQRVEEFNKHLDSLTEHFDIPKVSWTK